MPEYPIGDALEPQLSFNVDKQQLTRQDRFYTVADSVNYLRLKVNFSNDWATWITPLTVDDEAQDAPPQPVPIEKTALFSIIGESYAVPLVDEADDPFTAVCEVPYKVIMAPGFYLTIYGGGLLTTNAVFVDVEKSGLGKGSPFKKDPLPSVQEQLNALKNDITKTAEAAEEASQSALATAQELKEQAEAGDFTPAFTIGTVETVDSDQQAEVTITGTKMEPVLNFKIPRGEKGEKGDKGDKGDPGGTPTPPEPEPEPTDPDTGESGETEPTTPEGEETQGGEGTK